MSILNFKAKVNFFRAKMYVLATKLFVTLTKQNNGNETISHDEHIQFTKLLRLFLDLSNSKLSRKTKLYMYAHSLAECLSIATHSNKTCRSTHVIA